MITTPRTGKFWKFLTKLGTKSIKPFKLTRFITDIVSPEVGCIAEIPNLPKTNESPKTITIMYKNRAIGCGILFPTTSIQLRNPLFSFSFIIYPPLRYLENLKQILL